MKSINKVKLTSTLCVLGLALACTPDDDDNDAELRSGLLLQSQVQWSEDVAGFEYFVTRVSCGPGDDFEPETYSATIGREDLMLPNGLPAFGQQPLDDESQHMFGDHFFVLPAGCYDVRATPLDDNGDDSDICYSASRLGVEVQDGLTTEILLISQCLGPARGGLDAVTTLNNPPAVENLEFEPSKIVSSCEAVEICLTASDPDNDPLEFEWRQVSGPQLAFGPEHISTTREGDMTRQCVLLQAGQVDSYELQVTVYDLAWYEGRLVRIERLLAEQGEPHPSHDDLQFPLHAAVDCPVMGRSLIIMMALDNQPGISQADARRLASNAVNWVHQGAGQPRTLVVLDEANYGDNPGDARFVQNQLQAAGLSNVDYVVEPTGGLTAADVENYDVVWFSNPGRPMNDASTHATLLNFRANGGGLILQGDDMAHFATSSTLMQPLTYLEYLNNGSMSCGVQTDNNAGENYTVTLDGPSSHPVLAGISGISFEYGNDIDHTTPRGMGEQVLATASFSRGTCEVNTNAIVAIDPMNVSP